MKVQPSKKTFDSPTLDFVYGHLSMNKRKILIPTAFICSLFIAFFAFRFCQTDHITMPWGSWERLQHQSREHPGHLPANWERTLATRDPQRIFTFVRDRITLIPPLVNFGGNQKLRYGIKGTLRTGKGTSLEKALLLYSGLQEIGLSPNLFYGNLDSDAIDSLYMPIPAGLPAMSGLKEIKKAQQRYGIKAWSVSSMHPVDSLLTRFADTLVASLAKQPQKIPNWENASRQVYLIGVEIDSQQVFLNPSLPGAGWGESALSSRPLPYNLPKRHPSSAVSIKLRASYDDRSYSPFTLAEGTWPLETVMGKDIRVGFKVLGAPEILLSTPVKAFESFVSVIEVLDPAQEVPDSLMISGDVITTRGTVISKERVANQLANDLLPSEVDPSKAAQVSIAPPKMADFPTLLLEADVKDDQGNALMGLDANDFEILVNGEKVTHRMVVNRKLPPRILFLYDDSGSMPKEYIDHSKVLEVFENIYAACHQINPDTEFAVSPFGDEETKIFNLSDWSRDLSYLTSYIARTRSGFSHNWSALLGATNVQDANMAILVTDADGTEIASDYANQRYKEGMPGLIYGVWDAHTTKDEFQKMADKTDGVYFNIDLEWSDAMEDLQKRIEQTKNERYLLEVEIENAEIPFMEMQVQVGNNGPISNMVKLNNPSDSYLRPAGKNAITGIYIELSYLNRTYTYKIAGVPLGANARTYPITQKMLDECNNALWGEYILHIEAGAPLPQVVLDEKCQHYLRLRPLVNLLDETDPQKFFAALQAIRWRPDYPGKWPVLLTQQQNFFENRLTCWIYSEYPDHNGQYWQSLNLLASQEYLSPHLESHPLSVAQALQGISQIEIASRNFGEPGLSAAAFKGLDLIRVSPYGRIPRSYFANKGMGGEAFREALTRNSVDQSRFFAVQGSFEGDLGFLLDNYSFNLTGIRPQGFLAGRKIDILLDKELPLLNQHHLWTKTLGMKMDTWMDLEGNKLAFIQMGTLAIQGLAEIPNSGETMNRIKDKIRTYIVSETLYPHEIFPHSSNSWLQAYDLARNNVSAFSITPSQSNAQ